MIEIARLREDDVGRRVIWAMGPGIEQEGQLAAWTDDRLLLALKQSGSRFLKISEEIDPAEVRWAEAIPARQRKVKQAR